MLQGNNIFNFYKDKANTRWENADIKEWYAIFETTKVPPFIIVATTDGLSGTVKLIDANDDSIKLTTPVTVTESNGNKIISSIGSTIAGEDGDYYLQVDIGTDTFYSDVFGWCTDLSNLIKISISSANLTMAGLYELPYSGFTYEFYLNINGIEIDSNINEKGNEKHYGDIPSFSTTTIIRSAEINGNNQIFRFLSTLRSFNVNGTIEVTVGGEVKQCYDFMSEIKESDSFGETNVILLKYKEQDYISTRNET